MDKWIRGSDLYTEEHFLTEVGSYLRSGDLIEVVVGADSQPFKEGTFVVVAVCVLSNNTAHHGRCFHKSLPMLKPFMDLYTRLYTEFEATLEVANALKQAYPSMPIVIHLDVNSNERGYTHRWSKGLVSIAKGFGYERVEIKPNAWCASCIADKYTKKPPTP